jgi:type I restriction enzyme S subunit
MKFESYNAYKDCNFPLIAQLPEKWIEQKIKFQLTDCVGGGTPESSNSLFWAESGEGTPWVSIADMTRSSVITTTEKDISDEGIDAKRLKIFPEGTLLYSIFASLGKVAEAGSKLTTNQAILALVPKDTLNKRFFKYWLQSLESFLLYYSTSNTQNNLNSEKVGNLPLFVASINEQQKIANFLDHETAKIDTLIAKQQQLIQLLKEKRQAVISHAVTKGLNPDAPMRDSGVEWLGEVPAHWVVAGFKKYLNDIVDYRGKTPEKRDSGVFLVTARNIKKGVIRYDASQEYVAEADYESIMSRGKPKIGDILFTTEAPMGEVASVDRVGIALAQRIIKFDGIDGILNNEYLKYLIMSDQFQQSLVMYSSGSTALGIKAERLVYLRSLIPPITEQLDIASHIFGLSKSFDLLVNKAFDLTFLLQERRTALISAAVTGKIDVRNWVSPDASSTANTPNTSDSTATTNSVAVA